GIKSWSEDDRPREKLVEKGTAALSNSELIAIIINNGTTDKSAVEVAKELLIAANNDLQNLGAKSVKELIQLKVKGIGPAKAVAIAAALELGNRRNASLKPKTQVTSSKQVADYLRNHLQHNNHEVFVVVYLNTASKVIGHEVISQGGIAGTIADPRVIFRKALANNASNIIVCHNHPSGALKPSNADLQLTKKIAEAALLLDMRLLDHLIVSTEGYFSFADEGLI
ncbi:MAG: RadC family protein, partial [Chitinophagaceae bacterium]